MNAPTPCPHAELMAEYAKDAAVHPELGTLRHLPPQARATREP